MSIFGHHASLCICGESAIPLLFPKEVLSTCPKQSNECDSTSPFLLIIPLAILLLSALISVYIFRFHCAPAPRLLSTIRHHINNHNSTKYAMEKITSYLMPAVNRKLGASTSTNTDRAMANRVRPFITNPNSHINEKWNMWIKNPTRADHDLPGEEFVRKI
jgi:hypothetical protein